MSRLSHFRLAIGASLFLLVPATAQETPAPASVPTTGISQLETFLDPQVTLNALVRRALENNPQPAIALARLEAARSNAAALKSLPNPVLQLIPGFSGAAEARDEEVVLSQPIDLFGQRKAQRKVREAQVRSTRAESLLITRALIVEVKNAATGLYAAQEAEKLGLDQVAIATQFRDAARRKAELGDAPPIQAQRAELELLRTRNELDNARAQRQLRRATLNQLIGQAPEAPLNVTLPSHPLAIVSPPAGPGPTPASPATDQIEKSLFSQRNALLSNLVSRPDIVGAQATLEAQRAQVGAIEKQRWPQLELQARRSAFFGREGGYAFRAVITAPLFDFGSIKNEKESAEANVRAQEAQIALLRSQAALQVEQALIRIDQQYATAGRYRNTIVPQTLDLLRKTQIGFAQGASTHLEVLEAQRTLRTVQAEYIQAIVGLRLSETELESALGNELPENFYATFANPQKPSATPGGIN